ncbi:hypothetical protein cyc_02595 [Cyclospora cayetanensis]|uniref:Transmembrane protein n=1 Tax=Cyclospora cayetanensis TaxID=88456 RepID=A0A1D3CUR7_9EIME|nr:hypothetical protein cyc_02595 [Cyclospora cayetanensis]
MAGQADKKRAREAEDYEKRHFKYVAIAAVLHIFLRLSLCWGYSSRIPSLMEALPWLFTLGALKASYSWQKDALLLGVKSSTATDVYIVALCATVLGGLHPWGWGVWLGVPLYCIYWAIKKTLRWVFTPDTPDDTSPEALAYKKKQEKLERKLKSGRYAIKQ